MSSLIVVFPGAAADLGGVGGPVAGGGPLPGDRDADVDAEQTGEDGCGQVRGELEQRSGTGLAGADTELAQAFGELEGADRLARLPGAPRATATARCPGAPRPAEDYLRESSSPYTLPALIETLGEVINMLSHAEREAHHGIPPGPPARQPPDSDPAACSF